MRRRALVLSTLALLSPAPAFALGNDSGDPPKPIYLELDRIVVSVFKSGEVVSLVMLALKLELADDGAITPVVEKMPRLRDAFIREWNALAARPDAAEKGLDIEAGKRRMLVACDRVLGAGAVKSVLIQGVSQRKPPR
jgi:hypothetical protein